MTVHDRPRNAYGQYIREDGTVVPEEPKNPGLDYPAGYPTEERKHLTVAKLNNRLLAYNDDLQVLITTRHAGHSVSERAKHVRLHESDGHFAVEIVGDAAHEIPGYCNLGHWVQLCNLDWVRDIDGQAFNSEGKWLGPVSDMNVRKGV